MSAPAALPPLSGVLHSRPPGGIDATAAVPVAAESSRRHRADYSALLLQRVRLALAMAAAAVVMTTAVDLPAGDIPPTLLLALKAIDLGMVALAYTLSRSALALRHATLAAFLVPVTGCTVLALSGIATGDSHGTLILCVGTVLVTATLFPWGIRTQLATAAFVGVAIAAHLHWVANDAAVPVSYHAAAAALLTLAVSVVITYERQSTWRAMHEENTARARAEREIAKLNLHLERVVNERTALLEATKDDLERQIADHKVTLELLRTQERQLLDIVDNSSALIYVKDLDGRYRFMGIQCERRFHIARDQIVGKTVADLFPAAMAAAFAANDRAVLASNQALETEDIVPVGKTSRTYLSLKFPLRDAAGAPYGLCGITTDITERKQMETELQRTEALFSSVIESSNEAIWSLDRQYRFTALNAVVRRMFRTMYGTDPEIGASLDDCLPVATRIYWRERYEQALSGQHLVVEHQVIIDGLARQVLVSLNPVSEDGTVTGVVVFTKEITGFRRAEAQLRQHQAELAHALRLSTIGEMATSLAQDLRRPLTVIATAAQDCRRELQSGHPDSATFAQRIGQVTAEALGAAESLRHLRRLVRKDSATDDGIDVNEVTRNALRIVEVGHPELPLQLSLAAHLPPVHGDRTQLEQVVLNLLLNALDALQAVPVDARSLAVHTLLADGPAVEVAVRDTGAGVDPAIGDTLFAPFVTTKPNALGMGLAISRSIVEAHGGQLWTTPNPEGGSVFQFTLPLP